MRASFFVGSVLAASLLLAPNLAHAAEIVSGGVGVLLGGGVVGLAKPGDTTVQLGGLTGQDNTYPGFFGGTIGAGASAEIRLIEIIGLEVDALYQFSERGSGDLTVGNRTFDISIGQPAFHVPIFAKAVIPLPLVRPFIGIGPELVFPGTATAEVSPSTGIATTVTAKAESYVMLSGTLGVEIKLPLPALDLRIPIAFRGGFNPGTSDKIVDRRDVTLGGSNALTGIQYKSEWQFQGSLVAGLQYWF